MSDSSSERAPHHPARCLYAGTFFVASLTVAAILWHFHDRFWYPVDEGNYANVAERLLSGEVLNLQVQDVHPGYGSFVNAAAFRLFGIDLLSLRYPLIFSAFLESCFAFALLVRRSVLFAMLGAVASAALGVVQFLDPTPNWYCLSIVFALAFWITTARQAAPFRLIGAGFCVGLICLFRQLSGAWVSMGILVIVLLERRDASTHRGFVARSVLIGVLILLVAFVAFSRQAELGAVALFVAWPFAILLIALKETHIADKRAATAIAQLTAGAILAALPLIVYCLTHHSAGPWIKDNVVTASRLDSFVKQWGGGAWFAALPIAGAYEVVTSFNLIRIANGIYWLVLPLLAAVNGLLTIRELRHGKDVSLLALPILAAFYGIGTLFLQDAIYLYFTVGLTLTAVLWHTALAGWALRTAVASVTLLLIVVAITCHAGQPYTRTGRELLEGHLATTFVADAAIARCSLQLAPQSLEPYRQLTALIQKAVPQDEPMAALPSDAELYFLSHRRNLFGFYNSALGVQTPEALDHAIKLIEREAPPVITFRPADKYNTEASRSIMEWVRLRYERTDMIDGVEVYRLKSKS